MKIIFQNRRLMENSFERRNLINNFEVDGNNFDILILGF
jgi:hypothetical protein